MEKFFVFDQGGMLDFNYDSATRLLFQVGDVYFFERYKKVLGLVPLTKTLWKVKFFNKTEVEKWPCDFEHKDYVYHYYSVWPEILKEIEPTQTVDLDLFKC